jgi:predicted transcriptional regulator
MSGKQVSFRTDAEKIAALDSLADVLDRDRSYVINQAVDAYLELHRWQADHIARAKAEADAGGPFVAHEDVKSWAASLGTSHEGPPPPATISKPRRVSRSS